MLNGIFRFERLPDQLDAEWIRVKADTDCKATVYFHYTEPGHDPSAFAEMFAGLADIEDESVSGGLIRPAAHNRSLQYLQLTRQKNVTGKPYYEVDQHLTFNEPEEDRGDEVSSICKLEKGFTLDEASVIVKDHSGTFLLPKTHARYDQPFSFGWPRDRRQLESELIEMLNIHGTIFEVARESGLSTVRPICTHKKRIIDYCTWRGLLVLSGTKTSTSEHGHYFASSDQSTGLWFGAIDDLWKLGKPVGYGGPWKETKIEADEFSIPYLMTGYGRKKLELYSSEKATFTLEVDVDHHGWHRYEQIHVGAGKTITHEFPKGYSAHWIRFRSDQNTKTTAMFTYS